MLDVATRDIPRPMTLSGTHEPEWKLRKKNDRGQLAAVTGITPTVQYARDTSFAEASWIGDPEPLAVTLAARANEPLLWYGTLSEAQKGAFGEMVDEVIYEVLIVAGIVRAYQAFVIVDR